MKTTEYLLDSSVWNQTYLDEMYATWTIGAPTLEMIIKSYNKYYNKNIEINAISQSDTGYKMYNEMKLVKNSIYNNGISYWAAAPSDSKNFNKYVSGEREDLYTSGIYNSVGIRPIVCLNSSVTLILSED